jgi:hypothetical protein
MHRFLVVAFLMVLSGVPGCRNGNRVEEPESALTAVGSTWIDKNDARLIKPLDPGDDPPQWERRIVTSASQIITLSAMGGPDGSVRLADESDDWPEPIDFGPRYAGVVRLAMDRTNERLFIEAAQKDDQPHVLYTYDLAKRALNGVESIRP